MASTKFDDRATSTEPSTPAMALHLRHSMEPLMAAQSQQPGEIHATTPAVGAQDRSTATPLNGRAGTNATHRCKTQHRTDGSAHHSVHSSPDNRPEWVVDDTRMGHLVAGQADGQRHHIDKICRWKWRQTCHTIHRTTRPRRKQRGNPETVWPRIRIKLLTSTPNQ